MNPLLDQDAAAPPPAGDDRTPAQLREELQALRERLARLEKARAEEADAGEMRSRLAAIVDSSQDAIIGKTLAGVITSWNRGAEQLYGYRAEEVRGKSVALLHPPGHEDELPNILERLRRGERVEPFDTVRRRKDGTLLDVSLSVSPIRNAAGAVTGASAIARDITARNRAERLYRNLLECAPDAMVITDRAGVIVLLNTQAEKMFGYGREELIGEAVEVLVPERFRAAHVGQRNDFVAHPRVRPMGVRRRIFGRHKDGREFPVEISLSPLETDAGLLVTSTVRDITERERVLAELRKAEVRYRTLVEEIPAVTFMASLDGDAGANELYVSPQIEALLGFTQKEWLEDPVLWHRQLHPEDRARWNREFAPTVAEGKPFHSVYRFVARDGRVVWVRGDAKVVKDEDGRPLYLHGIAFDITAIKEAEEELRKLNQTLEQRVAERTAAAEQRSAELGRSNKELEKYAQFVAHELKEPLRSVINFTKELDRSCRGKLDAEGEDSLMRIRRAGERMSTKIKMMLKYAQVGKGGGAFTPADCAAALEGALLTLHALIQESGAEVTADYPLPVVDGHASELEQLFENLVGNALKYRAARPPRVHVGVRRQGADWLFSVRDNGMGIEKKFWDKVWEIFKRLHTRGQIEGTGIGLALCKRVVEHHGGRIWLESEPGQGSTFYFTLPAREEGAGAGPK